jgi:hypothetical protein
MIRIDNSKGTFFQSICRERLNAGLFHSIFPLDESSLNCANVIAELKLSSASGLTFDYESQIAFCSSHFYELPVRELGDLSFDLISPIISHKILKLFTEDSLYQSIKDDLSIDADYSSLVEFI